MLQSADQVTPIETTWRPGVSNIEGLRSRPAHPLAYSVRASPPTLDQLAFLVAVQFRQHEHIGNVLTHICGRDWAKLEQALRSVFDRQTVAAALSPLETNIVELLSAQRGVTGRIARPYFEKTLSAILEPSLAAGLVRRIDLLFAQIRSVSCGAAIDVAADVHGPPEENS